MKTPLGIAPNRHMWLASHCLQQDLYLLHLITNETPDVSEKYLQNVYRVQIMGSERIRVIKLGMGVDEEVEGIYSSIDALPNWIKERLAVLMVVDAEHKPTNVIEGVGRRISAQVFWVFIPESGADATVSL